MDVLPASLSTTADVGYTGSAGTQVNVSFGEYLKVGIPVTLLTLALGIAWLQFVAY